MNIDDTHTPIPFRLAVDLVPRSSQTGHSIDVSCMYRWTVRGLCTQSGRVYLKARKVGSCMCVTPSDLQAFLRATSDGSKLPTNAAKSTEYKEMTSPRIEASHAVDEKLDQAGF